MSMPQHHWMGYVITTFPGPQMGREDSLDAWCQLADTAEAEVQVSLDQNLPS